MGKTTTNKTVRDAQANANDEFYTPIAPIAKTFDGEGEFFRGKTVYLNCDSPFKSEFFRYFVTRFHDFGLKRLICTCYDGRPQTRDGTQEMFGGWSEHIHEGSGEFVAWKADITADKLPPMFGMGTSGDYVSWAILRGWLTGNDAVLSKLKGSGSFQSEECLELLRQSDVVCTNPPFSLIRWFVDTLVEWGGDYAFIGNQCSCSYKRLANELVKLRCRQLPKRIKYFYIPATMHQIEGEKIRDGMRTRDISIAVWYSTFSTLPFDPPIQLTERFDPAKHKITIVTHWTGQAPIECESQWSMPMDYAGTMAVPISFLQHLNPEQFEILSMGKGGFVNGLGHETFARLIVKLRNPAQPAKLHPALFKPLPRPPARSVQDGRKVDPRLDKGILDTPCFL